MVSNHSIQQQLGRMPASPITFFTTPRTPSAIAKVASMSSPRDVEHRPIEYLRKVDVADSG